MLSVMTVMRPALSLTKSLVKSVNNISCAGLRRVSLSTREVTPFTIKQARAVLQDMLGTLYSDGTGGGTIKETDDMLPIKQRQEDCPVRHMSDSYQEVIIPLGKNPLVRENYMSFTKSLRFGRLLEDLDTFAVLICYTHNQDPSKGRFMKSPLSTVTARVDRIDLHHRTISATKDVKMRGHVTWVGRSSMEVTMVVEQEVDSNMKEMMTARFVMVSLNPQTKQATVVNRLQPVSEQEKALFELGERNKAVRVDKAKKSLLKIAPTEEERNFIHNIFLQTIEEKSGSFSIRVKPGNSEWMERTRLKTMHICHPEQKNVYHKVFGGFLMRQAFELAWANAAMYGRNIPVLKIVDDIVFHKPVEIGSLLYLSSQVVYTEKSLMLVKVHAEVLGVLTESRETTNDFYFVFDSRQDNLPTVVPRTYAESMLFLDGMRHMKASCT